MAVMARNKKAAKASATDAAALLQSPSMPKLAQVSWVPLMPVMFSALVFAITAFAAAAPADIRTYAKTC